MHSIGSLPLENLTQSPAESAESSSSSEIFFVLLPWLLGALPSNLLALEAMPQELLLGDRPAAA